MSGRGRRSWPTNERIRGSLHIPTVAMVTKADSRTFPACPSPRFLTQPCCIAVEKAQGNRMGVLSRNPTKRMLSMRDMCTAISKRLFGMVLKNKGRRRGRIMSQVTGMVGDL